MVSVATVMAHLQGVPSCRSLHEGHQPELGNVQLAQPNVAALPVVKRYQMTCDTLAMNTIKTTVLLYWSQMLEEDAGSIKDI